MQDTQFVGLTRVNSQSTISTQSDDSSISNPPQRRSSSSPQSNQITTTSANVRISGSTDAPQPREESSSNKFWSGFKTVCKWAGVALLGAVVGIAAVGAVVMSGGSVLAIAALIGAGAAVTGYAFSDALDKATAIDTSNFDRTSQQQQQKSEVQELKHQHQLEMQQMRHEMMMMKKDFRIQMLEAKLNEQSGGPSNRGPNSSGSQPQILGMDPDDAQSLMSGGIKSYPSSISSDDSSETDDDLAKRLRNLNRNSDKDPSNFQTERLRIEDGVIIDDETSSIESDDSYQSYLDEQTPLLNTQHSGYGSIELQDTELTFDDHTSIGNDDGYQEILDDERTPLLNTQHSGYGSIERQDTELTFDDHTSIG
ncbi:hypothetical protein, partial [Pleionea sp. CnH1-48]|uniref:hypothetical protein n=1 Tax=Pleionea sp. CnH1-48 TaxID=2954494 RepID=UPI0020968893